MSARGGWRALLLLDALRARASWRDHGRGRWAWLPLGIGAAWMAVTLHRVPHGVSDNIIETCAAVGFLGVILAPLAGLMKYETRETMLRWCASLPLPPRRVVAGLILPGLMADVLRTACVAVPIVVLVPASSRPAVGIALATVPAVALLLSSLSLHSWLGGTSAAVGLVVALGMLLLLMVPLGPHQLHVGRIVAVAAAIAWPAALAIFLLASRALVDRSWR